MSLLVIGTLAYDTIETVHERREGVLGGSATYFALASSPFARSRLVGVVGRDFQERHVKLLRDHGVDTAGLEVADGRTFRWSGRYEADWNTRQRGARVYINSDDEFSFFNRVRIKERVPMGRVGAFALRYDRDKL